MSMFDESSLKAIEKHASYEPGENVKMQLWSTDGHGDPNEMLAEINVSEQDWNTSGVDPVMACNLMRDLHADEDA